MSNVKFQLLALIGALMLTPLIGQSQFRFQSFYGSNGSDGWVFPNFSKALVKTPDSNFMGVSTTTGFGNQNLKLLASKFDQKGDPVWAKTYGTDSNERFFGIKPTSKGYLIAGATQGFAQNGPLDGLLIHIDEDGNQDWTKVLSGKGSSLAVQALETSDSGFLSMGITSSEDSSVSNLHLLKLNQDGSRAWETVVGHNNEPFLGWDMEQVADGYLVTGQIGAIGTSSDAQLLKLAKDGSIDWIKRYPTPNQLMAFKDVEIHDSSLYFFGLRRNGPETAIIVKTGMDGSVDWAKSYGQGPTTRGVNGHVNESGNITLYGTFDDALSLKYVMISTDSAEM